MTALDTQEYLVPYLPRLVLEWSDLSPEVRHRVVDGTIAFVDISGFTKLSEGLAKHGNIGAEELAATIEHCFVELLEIAYANGGRLLKFGGDALLLLFTTEGHESRACRAAFDMRRRLREVGRLGVLGQRVTLRMSVGVHSGKFDMFLVGATHRELVVTGPAASTTVSMESKATAGEILVSDATCLALEHGDLGEARDGGRLLRRAPHVSIESVTPRDLVDTASDLTRYLPAAIVRSVLGLDHEPEHRRVTVAFIHFDGMDELITGQGTDVATAYLDSVVTDVQKAVERYGVTFIGSDIDHDGGKIILVAGAPESTGDDEHHMLLALREVMDTPRTPALRIGVNRGPVFAGDIGPAYRRTFTVMGDTVNLAARVMTKATPGQILATPEVLSRSRSAFDLRPVEPFYVKGKARPVEAFEIGQRLGGRTLEGGDRLPLVGRDAEMHAWTQAIERAKRSQATLIEIIGEPGVGKSRLIEEFRATAGSLARIEAACEEYAAATPYAAVRRIVTGLLGLSSDDQVAPAAESVQQAIIRLAPDLISWAPLVGDVIGVTLEPTEATRDLDPEFRTLRLGEVVADLLGRLVTAPTAFIIEDAHWMDVASSQLLLRACAAAASPWIVCVTRRDVEDGFVAPDGATRMRLAPLSKEAAIELAQAAAGATPLSARMTAALTERAGGNPLFLRELLAAARDHSDVDALPDSVEAVIAARIDRLAPDDRSFLRRVSVLGRSAPVALLEAVVPEIPDENDSIWPRVAEFLTIDGSGEVSFRHALLRDSAYEGLSYRLRRELHGRVADALRTASQGDDHVELLSLHYLHAQRFLEAWEFSLAAAKHAQAVQANTEAAEFFERALSAGRRLGDLSPSVIAEVHEGLGDARHRTGELLDAASEFQLARKFADDDPVVQARLMLKVASVRGGLDRYSSALRWLSRGLRTLEHSSGDEVERCRAQLMAWYARLTQELGRHDGAVAACHRAIAQAELAGDKAALALALGVLDWARLDLGTLDEPTNWRRALELMEEIGDLQGQGTMLNSLAMFEYFHGHWNDALELYGRAQERARRSGNAVQLAIYEANAAEIALDQGRVEEARRLLESMGRILRAAGYKTGAAYVACHLGRCEARAGRFDAAAELFATSQREAQALGSQEKSLEASARWAEADLMRGDASAALARARSALEADRALGGGAQLPLLQRVIGVALAKSGDVMNARGALNASLAAARERKIDYEIAATLDVMAVLEMDAGAESPRELVAERDAILAQLGVAELPVLLSRSDLQPLTR